MNFSDCGERWPVWLAVFLTLSHYSVVCGEGVREKMSDAQRKAEENAERGAGADGLPGALIAAAGRDMRPGGTELKDSKGSVPADENAMEVALQQLQEEIDNGDVRPTGNFGDVLIKVARQYVDGIRQGPPSVFHTPLELDAEAESGSGSGVDEGSGREARTIGRRQVIRRSSRWWGGVIPVSFKPPATPNKPETAAGEENIRAAFAFYEKNTCLKFPEKTPTLKEELGLPHDNYLHFIRPDAGGCWSGVGNWGGKGQSISCCSGTGVALHELGHAMGFAHEQNRGDRHLHVAMHPENADAQHKGTFNGNPDTSLELLKPYDLGSMMQYGMYGFSYTGLPTLTTVDPDDEFLIGNKEGLVSHYDLLAITKYYDCTDGCPADKKALKCKNDGFLALTDEKCGCRCPNVFQGETCQELFQPVDDLTTWPAGMYGLPMTVSGCPGGDWLSGSRYHVTEWGSGLGSHAHLKPLPSGSAVEDYFCMRPNATSTSKTTWGPGKYCIYQQDDTCPDGFESGWLFFDDDNENESDNDVNGATPKGEYGSDTKYYYCCRNDGLPTDPIKLPRSKPFHLLRHGGQCQQVTGMLTTAYYLHYQLENTNTKILKKDPVPSYNDWYSDYWIYYCYYTRIDYDCGGIIDLTDAKPEVTIQSPNYPANYNDSTECTWYVRGPPKKTLVVDFDDFDIEDSSRGSCLDSVEVRHTLVGQPGERYCGEEFKRSLISNREFALITFRSSAQNTRKGFSSKVRVVQEREECLSVEDHGASYRGKMDFTQHYHRCIPWEKAQHCEVNPFAQKYIHSGLVGHNQCRNPNGLLRPWCYINEFCEVDFCDVCGITKCYNYFHDCTELLGRDPSFCEKELGFHGCHKSCNFCGAGIDKTVTNCKAPTVKDKMAKIEDGKVSQATFAFGEKIKLICTNSDVNVNVTSELTCLTDGTFSGQQIFCDISCPDGWVRFKANCYKVYLEEKVFYPAASHICGASSATLATIMNKEENDYVQSLVGGRNVYFGLNDLDKDDKWTYADGSVPTYNNWRPSEPSGGSERCAMLYSDGTWNDVYCSQHYKQYFVCQKPLSEIDDDASCVDENPNCTDIAEGNPKVCRSHFEFAFAHCRRSCGLCPHLECANPGVVERTVQVTNASYIKTGSYFEYKCEDKFELSSGNLGRACLRNGVVTGAPPVCEPEEEFKNTYGHRVMPRAKTDSDNQLTVYRSKDAVIGRDGKVVRWSVYSARRTSIVVQVWRSLNDSNSDRVKLIGQNTLTARPRRVTHFDVKSFEEITVKKGDLIGWYYPASNPGIVYSDCSTDFADRPAHQTDEPTTDLAVGTIVKVPLKDGCRSYSISATVAKGAAASYVNVAHQSRGGKCLGASSSVDICPLAIDGSTLPFDSAWVSENEGTGAFITIGFDDEYPLVGGRFMQRFAKSGQIKIVTLEFSDGSSKQVGLDRRQGTSSMDVNGRSWDVFELTNVTTSWVKVKVDSVYSTNYNGLIEIEFYAACSKDWFGHSDHCYSREMTEETYPNAEKSCVAKGGHLTTIMDETENNFISHLQTSVDTSMGDSWIGLTDEGHEGTWTWSDGSTTGFTKWQSGQPDNWNGNENCAFIRSYNKQWGDVHCTWYKRKYFCKRKLDNVKALPYQTYGNPVQPRSGSEDARSQGHFFMEKSAAMTVSVSGSIKAWKLYTETKIDVTMTVLRPVKGSETSFIVVGMNRVTTIPKRVALIDVPTFERINVQIGDLVAWYYPLGIEPDIPWSSCKSKDVKIIYIKHPKAAPVLIGQQLDGTITTWNGCRTYSVGFVLDPAEAGPAENIAGLSSGATCDVASSGADTGFQLVDGGLLDWDQAWVIEADDPVGANITIRFSGQYDVIGGRIMQRLSKSNQIKKVKLDFGNSNTKTVVLHKRLADSDKDYRAQAWDTFVLDSPVTASSVTISVISVYTAGKNGLIEVEIYASGCPSGWTRFRDACYKHHGTSTKLMDPAEADCVSQGSHLATVADQSENNFLKVLSGGSIYLGYRRADKISPFDALDGSNMTFTNWATGEPNGASKNYLCISMEQDGKWADTFCQWHYPKYWVCKKPLQTATRRQYDGQPAIPRSKQDGRDYLQATLFEPFTVKHSGSISHWKLYSSGITQVEMIVLRPVPGAENTFTIQGQNLVETKGGYLTVSKVPEIHRINVKNGDLIGWYYVPTAGGVGLSYDSCRLSETPMKVLYIKRKSDMSFVVGDKVKFDVTSYYGCRLYSVRYMVEPVTAPKMQNVAGLAFGASCTASSSAETCALALDGGLLAYESSWVSHGEGAGAWIQITFSDTYTIHGGRIMQRLCSCSKAKDIELSFSDGSKQQVTLPDRVGTSPTDYRAQVWDAFTLSPVSTTSVKVTMTTVYTTQDNGFIEVQLIATGCPTGWKRFRNDCYKLHDAKKKLFHPAEADCVSEGGHVSSVSDLAENQFLLTMAGGQYIYLGYEMSKAASPFVSKDGSSVGFTNWKAGEPNDAHKNEFCVSLRPDGEWEDTFCKWYRAKNWICKKPMAGKDNSLTLVGSATIPRPKVDGDRRVVIPDGDARRFKADGVVTHWKVYGKQVSTLILQVWRQKGATSNKFNLIGQSTVVTEAGRVTISPIPLADRIMVKAGDVIGLHYPGGAVGVTYSQCNGIGAKMTVRQQRNFDVLTIGSSLMFETINTCREYSVEAMLTADAKVSSLSNVGSGSSCEASENSDTCSKAIDGELDVPNSEWVLTGSAINAWFKVALSDNYTVSAISIMQRLSSTGQSKTLDLEFSDGSKQQVTLAPRIAGSAKDKRGAFWDTFDLTPVATDSVKISILDTYTDSNNGFVEIKVLGECAAGWSRFRDWCYRMVTTKLHWQPAEDNCESLGATLPTVYDKEESDYIRKVAGNSAIWIGYKDDGTGRWSWADGKTSGFTQWGSGYPSGTGSQGYCASFRTDGYWYDKYCKRHNAQPFVCKKNAPGISSSKRSVDRNGEEATSYMENSEMSPPAGQPTVEPGAERRDVPPSSEQPTVEPGAERRDVPPSSEQPTVEPGTERRDVPPSSEQPTVEPGTERRDVPPSSEQPTVEPGAERRDVPPSSEQPTAVEPNGSDRGRQVVRREEGLLEVLKRSVGL